MYEIRLYLYVAARPDPCGRRAQGALHESDQTPNKKQSRGGGGSDTSMITRIAQASLVLRFSLRLSFSTRFGSVSE